MKIELIRADITLLEVDAIVNAANSQMQHGGGVAGAILRRGGAVIQRESDRIGYVPVGNAAVTSAGALPCRYVIHAVGPRMGEGNEETKLQSATLASLERAEELRVRSLALPAISTGIFRFPLASCARIMIQCALAFSERARSLERVIFCLHDDAAYQVFKNTLEEQRAD